MFVFSRFWTNLLSSNHPTIRERTKSDTEDKSSKCLLVIMTLVSSANFIGSDKELIPFGR